jgi:glycosyltransferase involved in cell wall biosynthesis
LLQDYPNLEYIIIDGGSRDDSLAIIKKYTPWLTYWVSEPDNGQAHALNKGFAKASGKIYAYLNSDDLLLPNALRCVATHFETKSNKPVIINFGGFAFGDFGEIYRDPPEKVYLSTWLRTDAVIMLLQQSTFWTSRLHKTIGGFREDLCFCFDKDFFIKAIFKFGKYESAPATQVAKFRHHQDAKTARLASVMWEENHLIATSFKQDRHFAQRLEKEKYEIELMQELQSALDKPGLIKTLNQLAVIFWRKPSVLSMRPYLGAWKRVLKHLFSPAA